MVDSTVSCLIKELKEDPKTRKWFRDRTSVFKEFIGEDWEIQKVIKNVSIGQFTAVAPRVMKVSKVSANNEEF